MVWPIACRVSHLPRMDNTTSRGTKGFTLVELMVVVAILGVLASVAIVSFRKYLLRAKVSEAYTMLGVIRERQETYRAEFNQFCDVSSSAHDGTVGSASGFWPTASPGAAPTDWYASLPAEWTQLGVKPSGPVYFRYDTVGGNPGVAPSFFGSDLGYAALPDAQKDAWWAAHAYGDLDGDGTRSTFEAFSLTNRIWVKDSLEAE